MGPKVINRICIVYETQRTLRSGQFPKICNCSVFPGLFLSQSICIELFISSILLLSFLHGALSMPDVWTPLIHQLNNHTVTKLIGLLGSSAFHRAASEHVVQKFMWEKLWECWDTIQGRWDVKRRLFLCALPHPTKARFLLSPCETNHDFQMIIRRASGSASRCSSQRQVQV